MQCWIVWSDFVVEGLAMDIVGGSSNATMVVGRDSPKLQWMGSWKTYYWTCEDRKSLSGGRCHSLGFPPQGPPQSLEQFEHFELCS